MEKAYGYGHCPQDALVLSLSANDARCVAVNGSEQWTCADLLFL